MTRSRGLWAGIFVLAILTGCSNKDKTLNVEGSYTPVILNFSSNNEPPVRGVPNALTAIVQNPRGYAITYHWSTAAGTLSDSTAATAQWTPPNAIGDYAVTVSIQAHDDLNGTDFFKTRTFQIHVDNQFTRWTRSIATQLDVAPPVNGRLLYSEVRNANTGQSDVWGVDTPLGPPTQITHDFFTATLPTAPSDGSRVAFLGRMRPSDLRPSLWQVPGTGGDTTTATLVVRQSGNANNLIGGPRFAPTGTMLAYSSDTVGITATRPKAWMRDAGNLAAQPIPIQPTAILGGSPELVHSFTNPSWRGTGDSVVVEAYQNFGQANQASLGLYKFSAVGNPPTNPEPYAPWLGDLQALEPDWSPDGQHIVFSKRSTGHADRDIWIINAGSSDPSSARRVTSGPADEFHPRFSSDGTQIFFVSDRADGYGANGLYDTERRGVNVWSVSRFDLP